MGCVYVVFARLALDVAVNPNGKNGVSVMLNEIYPPFESARNRIMGWKFQRKRLPVWRSLFYRIHVMHGVLYLHSP